MSTIPIGSTDSARRAQAVIVVDRATGEPAAAGGGAGTSNTTEATQLQVLAAVETIATAASDTTTPLPVKGQAPITRLTPTILTSAYTTGTVLFATTSIANLVPANDQPVVLESLFIVDKDDEGVAITLHFFSANVALGTAGSAPSISDADAASARLGSVDIATDDYKDLGGVKVASLKGIGLNLAPASGTRDVYVAATVTGTPTFTATSDLVFGFGVLG